jgi:hypothetical protein
MIRKFEIRPISEKCECVIIIFEYKASQCKKYAIQIIQLFTWPYMFRPFGAVVRGSTAKGTSLRLLRILV